MKFLYELFRSSLNRLKNKVINSLKYMCKICYQVIPEISDSKYNPNVQLLLYVDIVSL